MKASQPRSTLNHSQSIWDSTSSSSMLNPRFQAKNLFLKCSKRQWISVSVLSLMSRISKSILILMTLVRRFNLRESTSIYHLKSSLLYLRKIVGGTAHMVLQDLSSRQLVSLLPPWESSVSSMMSRLMHQNSLLKISISLTSLKKDMVNQNCVMKPTYR